jgi:nucleotide-binding universal stress UspA family protein
MAWIKKIIAPVDFSELSEVAVRHAGVLARQFESSLTLLHVYFPEVFQYAGTEAGLYVAQVQPPHEEALANAQRLLKALAARISDGRPIETVVLEGDPAGEIVKFAQEGHADLIVMPTRGRGPFRRFILGSVTAKVLHDSDCPVFTGAHGADPPAREPRPYRNVACAIDLGPHSESVLQWAADFAAASNASLHLIHAAPVVKVSGRDFGMDVRAMLFDAVNEEIAKLLEKTGRRAEVHTDTADVTFYVPKVLSAIGADLLVVGRTSREGVIGRLRANTYALIRESPCPVVSV